MHHLVLGVSQTRPWIRDSRRSNPIEEGAPRQKGRNVCTAKVSGFRVEGLGFRFEG